MCQLAGRYQGYQDLMMVPVVSLVVYQKSQSALTFSVWLLLFQRKQKFLWYFCCGNLFVFSSLKNHKICRSDSLRCPHGRRAPRFHTYFRLNTAIHYLSPHISSRVTGGWISPPVHHWAEIYKSANGHLKVGFFHVGVAHSYIYSKRNLLNSDILTHSPAHYWKVEQNRLWSGFIHPPLSFWGESCC